MAKLKVVIPSISKEIKTSFNIKLVMLQVKNEGRFLDDALEVRCEASFEGKGKCNLLWDYPVSWGQEWQFEGQDAEDCLRRGIRPHRGGFEAENVRYIPKHGNANLLIFYTVEGGKFARVTEREPGPIIFLEMPGVYKMELTFEHKNSGGQIFLTEPKAYEIRLDSWDSYSIKQIN